MYKIYCLKLNTNEEVLVRYSDKEDDIYTSWESKKTLMVEKPLSLIHTPQGLGAIPWMGAAQTDQIRISTQMIVSIAPIKKELESVYLQSTSEIEIANVNESSLII